MAKFLDYEGLLYFWGKIKTLLAGKVDVVSGKGLSTNDFTAAYKSKLDGIAEGANKYSLPTASASTLGGVKVGSNLSISGDVLNAKDTTYAVMGAATSSAAGTAGLVPAPAAGAQAKFLRGDGTWVTPTNTTYGVATSSANGLMSKSDKAKLDAFGAAGTYALKSDITSMYRYKGSVASVSALPTSATTGDVYNVETDGMNYAWNGSAWDALGGSFEVPSITNSEIDTILAA